jgi:hypothetical protein
MTEHWIIRIGTGDHFERSSKFSIWGINSKDKTNTSKFIKEATEGDILWFVTSNSNGKAIAVSVFKEMKKRITGPLINISLTNEELGWTDGDGEWDIEINYIDLFCIRELNILTRIQSPRTYRRFSDNLDKIPVKLIEEYKNILKYSTIRSYM